MSPVPHISGAELAQGTKAVKSMLKLCVDTNLGLRVFQRMNSGGALSELAAYLIASGISPADLLKQITQQMPLAAKMHANEHVDGAKKMIREGLAELDPGQQHGFDQMPYDERQQAAQAAPHAPPQRLEQADPHQRAEEALGQSPMETADARNEQAKNPAAQIAKASGSPLQQRTVGAPPPSGQAPQQQGAPAKRQQPNQPPNQKRNGLGNMARRIQEAIAENRKRIAQMKKEIREAASFVFNPFFFMFGIRDGIAFLFNAFPGMFAFPIGSLLTVPISMILVPLYFFCLDRKVKWATFKFFVFGSGIRFVIPFFMYNLALYVYVEKVIKEKVRREQEEKIKKLEMKLRAQEKKALQQAPAAA